MSLRNSSQLMKNERPVPAVVDLRNPDGTAEGKPEVVFAADRLGVDEWLGGVQSFVVEVLIETAVQPVGAAAGGEGEHPSRHLAEFGGKITRLERELLDHFDRWLPRGRRRVVVVGGVLPIHEDAISICRLTVHAAGCAACRQHSGERIMNVSGARMAPMLPPPPPKLSGRLLIRFPLTLMPCSTLSDFSCGASAAGP